MSRREGSVYFIGCAEPAAIKIGFTTKNPRDRLRQLQVGNPNALRLIGWYPGTERDERDLHKALHEFRLEGEWFSVAAVEAPAFEVPFKCILINNRLTGFDPHGGAQ